MAEFKGDAIVLSGPTGTKLKSEILSEYYQFWWSITSGGRSSNYRNPTAIVELNAATGEVFIKDTGELLLGSAGHALDFKVNTANTYNLKVVCVEEYLPCYKRLKNVIGRRWPSISINKAEGPIEDNDTNVYLIDQPLGNALDILDEITLGNSLFFFDPLRNYEWKIINQVAQNRIKSFHKTGTEFIIFLFTSDWFKGRSNFVPLPLSNNEKEWTPEQLDTVLKVDGLFGDDDWREKLLNDLLIEDKYEIMVELYKDRLLRWFRYVLPLPFAPKKEQRYHIFMCSNFYLGVHVTRRFYEGRTDNPKYKPDNSKTYKIFRKLHRKLIIGLKGNRKPLEWKILWKIIKYHEGEICDALCIDFQSEGSTYEIQQALEWLEAQGYLHEIKGIEPMWSEIHPKYKLEWGFVSSTFDIDAPTLLVPLKP